MELVNFSAATSQGPFLSVNEDGFDYNFEENLYMIFDGFGGAGIGDQCVGELKKKIIKFYKNFIVDRDATLPFYYSPRFLMEGNALINAALISHYEIYKENLTKEMGLRSGASGILMSKSDNLFSLLSVGNCRAYLVRNSSVMDIFTDDSYRFLGHDKHDSFLKNIPLSGFGLFPDLHYQLRELRVVPNDKLVLLTDGVYGRLDESEIQTCIAKSSFNIKAKLEELFDLANRRGNLDNQTCMIFEF